MYFSGPHTWLYSFNETCRCVVQTDSLAAKLTFEHEGDESLDSPNPPGGVMRVGAVTVLKHGGRPSDVLNVTVCQLLAGTS